jgi:hypothetical protein
MSTRVPGRNRLFLRSSVLRTFFAPRSGDSPLTLLRRAAPCSQIGRSIDRCGDPLSGVRMSLGPAPPILESIRDTHYTKEWVSQKKTSVTTQRVYSTGAMRTDRNSNRVTSFRARFRGEFESITSMFSNATPFSVRIFHTRTRSS